MGRWRSFGRVVAWGGTGCTFAMAACASIPPFSLSAMDAASDASTPNEPDASSDVVDGGASEDVTILPEGGTRYRLFVTKVGVFGSFGEDGGARANADKFCRDAAEGRGRKSNWTALIWVNDTTGPFASVPFVPGVWHQMLADGGAGDVLYSVSGGRHPAPMLTEEGVSFGGVVWTGGGQLDFGGNCNNWTSSAAKGAFGTANFTDAGWLRTGDTGISCTLGASLYCIEVP